MKKLAKSFAALIFCLMVLVSCVSVASAANNMANVKPTATVNYNTVKLTWSAVSKATGYQVQQYKSKEWVTLSSNVTGTSYTISNLSTDVTYKFRVRAVRKKTLGTDYSKAWTEISAKPTLGKVTGLKATNYSGTVVKLSWSKVTGATGYEVFRSTDGKKWTSVGKTSKLEGNITKLTINKTYQFKVRAYRKTSSKTYVGAASAAAKIKVAVPKVATLKGTAATYNTLTLEWSKVNSATKYQLDVYDYSTKTWKKLKVVTGTSYKVSGLVTGKKYGFRVRAIQTISKKDYAGAYSASYSYTTKLDKVSSFKVTGLKATSVDVSWSKVTGASGYQVYVSYDGGKTWSQALNKYTSTTKTFKLKADTSYHLKVRAYRTASGVTAYGAYSNAVYITTPVSSISGFKVSESKGDVVASWTKAKNASGYALYTREKLVDDEGNESWSSWKTVNSSISKSANGCVIDFFKNNTEYEIRMREYVKVDGKTYYSSYSNIVKYFKEGVRQVGSSPSTNTSQYYATIDWTPVEGAVSYDIEKYYQISNVWLKEGSIEDTEYSGEGLERGTVFKISAIDKDGKVIKTYPYFTATAPGFTVDTSDYSVDVSWPAVKGAKYYAVCVSYTEIFNVTNVLKTLTTSTSVKNLYLEPGISRIAVIALADKPQSNIIPSSTAIADESGNQQYFYLDVALPELNIVTDTSSPIYNESVNSQLLYYVAAVNKTKYSRRKVTINSESEISYNISKIIVGDEVYKGSSIQDLLDLMQIGKDESEKLKLSDTEKVNESKTFTNSACPYTTTDSEGKTVQRNLYLRQYVEPSDSDIAYLYNSNDPAAWKNGISGVSSTKRDDGSVEITFKIKQEVFGGDLDKKQAYYHPGLITTIADMGGFEGMMTNERTSVGPSTITAVIGADGLLKSYSSTSPYNMNMYADLGKDSKGNTIAIGLSLDGNSKLKYTFVR